MWMSLSGSWVSLPISSEIPMPVDRGAMEHLVDDELTPDVMRKMHNYAVLDEAKKM